MENEKNATPKPEKVSLTIPIAIIVAGLIVAGAILVNGAQKTATKTPGSPESKLTKGTIAEEVGLNKKDFRECLSGGTKASIVEEDYQGGIKAGIEGTPYSVIFAEDGSKASINGAQSYETVKGMIEAALAGSLENEEDVKVIALTKKDHVRGNPNAPVIIIEYSDTECPFCEKFHNTMKQVMSEYEKDGKVAWVYRYFPLDALHSRARKEAEAVECAYSIGGIEKFWAYLDKIEEVSPLNNQLDPALL